MTPKSNNYVLIYNGWGKFSSVLVTERVMLHVNICHIKQRLLQASFFHVSSKIAGLVGANTLSSIFNNNNNKKNIGIIIKRMVMRFF